MRKLAKAMIPLLGAAVVVAGAVAASGATSASASVRPTIINGHPASEAYPLVYVGGCTGILIKSQWALSAKHCGGPSSVRVGSLMQHSGGTVVSVSQTLGSPAADIELLHLSSAVSTVPYDV
ncbi:MAG: snapalysin, partial [Cryptosporangiaceae bacterium]|nr:snapalysin [Cryptosporangiaceae bacterium]